MLPDFVDPLDAWIGRLRHGPMHRFTISRQGDYSGRDVEYLLRQYGIRIWGREIDDPDEFALLVKQRQSTWAEYLLCRAGVPLTCELLDTRNAIFRPMHQSGQAMPKPWQEGGIRAHTLVDHVVDWIDRLFS